MGSAASFQFCKRQPYVEPSPRKYEAPLVVYERCNDDSDKLIAVQEELDALKVERDRETMELVSYKLAIVTSLNVLKKKLSKEKNKNNRLWSAYCRVKYPHLYSDARFDNNRMIFDFSFTLMSSLRSIRQWRMNRRKGLRNRS